MSRLSFSMINAGMMSSKTCEWATPQYLFDDLDKKHGKFTLDVCATKESAKCVNYFDEEMNGLSQTWSGVCWMNPPYGRQISKWMGKAYEETVIKGNANRTVCLIPARTDTAWWHDYAEKGEFYFLRGRVKFVGATHGSAPFPSAIVIFNWEPRC